MTSSRSSRQVLLLVVVVAAFLTLVSFSWPSSGGSSPADGFGGGQGQGQARDTFPTLDTTKAAAGEQPATLSTPATEASPDVVSELESTTKAVAPVGTTGGRLPNGGPGQHRVFTIKTLQKTFTRPTPQSTFPFILDSFELNIGPNLDDETRTTVQTMLAVAMGRTRLSATVKGSAVVSLFGSIEDVNTYLFSAAPSWYASSFSDSFLRLRRRSKLFTFAITGGNDKRANYVEWTWGRRTPLQWYADAWTELLRPIVDLHPQYEKDRFKYLTFKISRIWQRVGEDFGSGDYDWYVRLWDDNYFYEENLWNCLGRLDPGKPMLVGKIGWRYLADTAIYPFAGGGAGWFVSRAGMKVLLPTISDAEKWFFKLRARRDIFLPHSIHDEDVFLTAWFHLINFTFINIPGVEHVSPGMQGKQRCMPPTTLYKLRWDKNATIVFDYPAHEKQFRIEDAWYAYTKPIVWHYMSPRRLVTMETLLYPDRKMEPMFRDISALPSTNSDIVKARKKCYPGFTGEKEKITPSRGHSVFEVPLPDPPMDADADK